MDSVLLILDTVDLTLVGLRKSEARYPPNARLILALACLQTLGHFPLKYTDPN